MSMSGAWLTGIPRRARYSFATWLVSDAVPINDVSKVMGHEQTSITLNRCTHPSPAYVNRVRDVFADFPLTRPRKRGAGNDSGHR